MRSLHHISAGTSAGPAGRLAPLQPPGASQGAAEHAVGALVVEEQFLVRIPAELSAQAHRDVAGEVTIACVPGAFHIHIDGRHLRRIYNIGQVIDRTRYQFCDAVLQALTLCCLARHSPGMVGIQWAILT